MSRSNQLRAFLREFWNRDYNVDVQELNSGLAKRGKKSAGFEPAPPSIVTGEPFELPIGDCIGVIGLNPKWQPGMAASPEFHASCAEHHDAANGFSAYEQRRSRYFVDGSTEFYGRYFSPLQNRLAEKILRKRVAHAADVFRGAAFKIDLLPWWSTDTSMIDQRRASTSIEPLRAWKEVIELFISELRPTSLVMNGCGMRDLAKVLLGCDLTAFRFGASKADVAYAGLAYGVPILAHRQLNAKGAPSSPEAYRRLVDAWHALTPAGAAAAVHA